MPCRTRKFLLASAVFPDLKKFQLRWFSGDTSYIPKFLKANPHLIEFKLLSCSFTIDTMRALSESGNIRKLETYLNYSDKYIFANVDFPYLYSLSTLNISYNCRVEYGTMRSLISSSLNLTRLYLMVRRYDSTFLTSILAKLKKLKFLRLIIEVTLDKELDLSILSKIPYIKLSNKSYRKIDYKLPSSLIVLKRISISSKSHLYDFNTIMDTYSDNSSWNIKLTGENIICRVASS